MWGLFNRVEEMGGDTRVGARSEQRPQRGPVPALTLGCGGTMEGGRAWALAPATLSSFLVLISCLLQCCGSHMSLQGRNDRNDRSAVPSPASETDPGPAVVGQRCPQASLRGPPSPAPQGYGAIHTQPALVFDIVFKLAFVLS